MDFQKYLNSAALKADPLCGISTYKDTLNLATGSCTKQIKKLVLTGQENWFLNSSVSRENTIYLYANIVSGNIADNSLCSHFEYNSNAYSNDIECYHLITGFGALRFRVDRDLANSETAWQTYLQQQYANGTPVTVWYVLATPTTETISLPSGLSGTLEGSLTQSGTPTPSAPIYPTAVTGEGWYDINNYIRDTTWISGSAYERASGAWT